MSSAAHPRPEPTDASPGDDAARPSCSGCGGTMDSNGWRMLRYADGIVRRQRLRCRRCGRTGWPETDGFSKSHRMAAALEERIGLACLSRPYAAVAEEAGVDEKTAKATFGSWLEARVESLRVPDPSVVGLIAVVACGEPCLLVCDVERLTLFDMLQEARDQSAVRRLPGNGRIATAICDASPGALEFARELWPSARLAVDPGATLALAAAAFDRTLAARARWFGPETRRALEEGRQALLLDAEARGPADLGTLDGWTWLEPELHALRLAKDSFWNIWDAHCSGEAADRSAIWRHSRHASTLPVLADLIDAWGDLSIPLVGDPVNFDWATAAATLRTQGLGRAAALDRRRFAQLRARLLLGGEAREGAATSLGELRGDADRAFPALASAR